jgi:hypothetical protein
MPLLLGSGPNQVSTNGDLGSAAFIDAQQLPVSTAQKTALNLKANIASPTFTGTVGGITSAMVGAPSGSGASSGTNTGDNAGVIAVTATSPVVSSGGNAPAISMPVATASVPGYLSSTDWSTFNSKQPGGSYPTGSGTVSGTNTGDQSASSLGLGSVTNTSDANKPVSTAQQTALNFKADIGTAQSFTKAQRGAVSALTDAATITPDFSLANNFSVTLGGSRTLANPTNIVAGQSGVITITQDATGSRTLAFGSYWKFSAAAVPALTSTANTVELLAYYVDSTTAITAKLIGDRR